jgi:serine/threonine protein phosphatase PrpC
VDVSASETTLCCPVCRAALLPDDRYCEQCGARVGKASADAESCVACGAPVEEIDGTTYCARCGASQPLPGDRTEINVGVAAGVTDRGRLKRRNEDALYLNRIGDGELAAVVCDGISSSLSPHVAAKRAAEAAGTLLADALGDPVHALGDVTESAVRAAQDAVRALPWTARSGLDFPSCTLVSAACRGADLAIGWLGDSRAYWVTAEDSIQLTVDDSWVQEQVDAGLLTEQQANSDPRAHSITRWLGRDAPDAVPQVIAMQASGPGRLVLCSDGLWNYAPAAADIAALLAGLPPAASPVAAARSLVDSALQAGGRDNITVAILDVVV